jgi:hypothetical protein
MEHEKSFIGKIGDDMHTIGTSTKDGGHIT